MKPITYMFFYNSSDYNCYVLYKELLKLPWSLFMSCEKGMWLSYEYTYQMKELFHHQLHLVKNYFTISFILSSIVIYLSRLPYIISMLNDVTIRHDTSSIISAVMSPAVQLYDTINHHLIRSRAQCHLWVERFGTCIWNLNGANIFSTFYLLCYPCCSNMCFCVSVPLLSPFGQDNVAIYAAPNPRTAAVSTSTF